MSLSVLSLGWEFPPHLHGGLGVAYMALNEALAPLVNLTAFVPQPEEETPPPQPVETTPPPSPISKPITQQHTHVYEYVTHHQETTYKVVHISIPHYIDPYTQISEIYSRVNPITQHYQQSHTSVVVTEETFFPDIPSFLPSSPPPKKNNPSSFFTDAQLEQPLFKQVHTYGSKALDAARNGSYDIIHAHDWMTGVAGVMIKRALNIPLVVHIHSLEYDRNSQPENSWIFEIEKIILNEADKVIAVSTYTKHILETVYHIPATRIKVIHNGIAPIESFRLTKHFPEKLILFIGRLTYQKGPEIFVEIASQILTQTPKVRFAIGGKGDQLPEIIRKTAQARIGDKVHFTGQLKRDEVNQLLAMADILLMPSVSEPFGLVALEAAQFGLPCILSKYAGVAEVLTHAPKANPTQPEQWADLVMEILEDDQRYHDIVAGQQQDLQHLNWPNAAYKTAKTFQEILHPDPIQHNYSDNGSQDQ